MRVRSLRSGSCGRSRGGRRRRGRGGRFWKGAETPCRGCRGGLLLRGRAGLPSCCCDPNATALQQRRETGPCVPGGPAARALPFACGVSEAGGAPGRVKCCFSKHFLLEILAQVLPSAVKLCEITRHLALCAFSQKLRPPLAGAPLRGQCKGLCYRRQRQGPGWLTSCRRRPRPGKGRLGGMTALRRSRHLAFLQLV